MIALISDIHSNIEALQAVFDDIARRSIRRVICLGDVVGYGPNPC
ncbi:MAG: metallophosphoesterase, partial [Phycisphaerae bacterium]|nr:metallophosphoesterase [Phycisphaerae bacterium]